MKLGHPAVPSSSPRVPRASRPGEFIVPSIDASDLGQASSRVSRTTEHGSRAIVVGSGLGPCQPPRWHSICSRVAPRAHQGRPTGPSAKLVDAAVRPIRGDNRCVSTINATGLVRIGRDEAGIDAKALATDEALIDATLQNYLEKVSEQTALPEAPMYCPAGDACIAERAGSSKRSNGPAPGQSGRACKTTCTPD